MRTISSGSLSVQATVVIIVLAVGFGGCAIYRHTTLTTPPPSSPWEALPDMQSKLGRFVLAQDGRRIYRLGGVSRNIRSGGTYSGMFSSYDPSSKQWETLPFAPFGTGNAFLEYWPEQGSFLAIAGIARLGDTFNTDGVTVGLFHPVERIWTTKELRCEGLGRVSCVAHAKKSNFLVLAQDKIAMLNVAKDTIRVISTYPVSGRTLGAARIRNTLFVLQGESLAPCRLHRFDVRSGTYLGSVDTSEVFFWTDKLVSWRNQLLVWKNSGPRGRNEYAHSSCLLRIDSKTGICSELHPDYPGPRARRSTDAVILGDSLYTFGGQRKDAEWLQDAHVYHFLLGDRYCHGSPKKAISSDEE